MRASLSISDSTSAKSTAVFSIKNDNKTVEIHIFDPLPLCSCSATGFIRYPQSWCENKALTVLLCSLGPFKKQVIFIVGKQIASFSKGTLM